MTAPQQSRRMDRYHRHPYSSPESLAIALRDRRNRLGPLPSSCDSPQVQTRARIADGRDGLRGNVSSHRHHRVLLTTFSKGKVESAVGHAKKTPLQGQRFESLEQAQAYLDRWEANWADTRIHGTTKRQVAAMFAEEKPTLLPLPVEPFRYYQYGERVVHLDGCVEVEAAYYGLPPGWIGRGVKVQWDELCVRILDPKTGLLLREHIRQKRGWYRIQPEDHPQRTPFRVVQLLGRAGRVGTHVGTLCNLIYRQHDSVNLTWPTLII